MPDGLQASEAPNDSRRSEQGKSVQSAAALYLDPRGVGRVQTATQGDGERCPDATEISDRCKGYGQATVEAAAHHLAPAKSPGGDEEGGSLERRRCYFRDNPLPGFPRAWLPWREPVGKFLESRSRLWRLHVLDDIFYWLGL